MAYLSYCASCNVGCQSTNTCNSCNSCESCNVECNTPGGCNTLQAFCEISSQSAGGFGFGVCVRANEIIGHESDNATGVFTRKHWNNLISYINTAFAKGTKQNGGSSGVGWCSDEFITATSFNAVSSALGKLGSAGPGLWVNKDDIIYGHYFTSLEYYANNLLLKEDQCDKCNVDCDVTCKECQKCNTSNCGSCNGSCEAHEPSYGSYCCYCDSCQSACELNAQVEAPCLENIGL